MKQQHMSKGKEHVKDVSDLHSTVSSLQRITSTFMYNKNNMTSKALTS